jgi:hypothetical protein
VTWAFSGEDGASFECNLTRDAAAAPDWAPCTSPGTFALEGPDGPFHFAVRATDAAGNVGAAAVGDYELDRSAPDAPLLTYMPPAAGSGRAPTWRFWTAGDHTECRLTLGTVVISAWADCDGSATYHLDSRSDGSYTFALRAVDAARNASPTVRGVYRLDRTAPAPPTLTSTPPATGEATSVTWAFEAEDHARFECFLTRTPTGDGAWTPCTSPTTYELDGPDGAFRFAVRAVDAVGNPSGRTTSEYRLHRSVTPEPSGAPTAPGSDPVVEPEPDPDPQPESEPEPEPAAAAPLPAATEPELGRSAVAGTVKGTVQVRVPGSERYVSLDANSDIPIGAVVDATHGEVKLQTALDAQGRTQSATFSGGAFQIKQDPRAKGMVDLHLRGGSRAGCPPTGRSASSPLAAASAKKKRVVRSLWGRDRGGRYRTHGQDSVANVRGTRWLTQDRCDGTLTRVTQGAVEVRPKRGRRRVVLVRAGHSFLAPRPG